MNSSFGRQIGMSLLVQGAGSAAVLAATLLVGAVWGPEVQGGFSQTKANIEFAAAVAMCGLPQALFFHVHAGAMHPRRARRWGWISAALALVAACAALGLCGEDPWAAGSFVAAGAVALSVLHGQLRALSLAGQGTIWFNTISALPQLLMLCCVAVWAFGSVATNWAVVFLLAFGVSAVVADLRLRAVSAAWERRSTEPTARTVAGFGAAAWVGAMLATALPVLLQRWVDQAQGARALGVFTMALALAQAPLVPIGFVVPLLFRRWMSRPDSARVFQGAASAAMSLLIVAAVVWIGSTRGMGDAALGRYAGVAAALAALLVGTAAEAASRLLAAHANASGMPWVVVWAEAARWSVLGLAWVAWQPTSMEGLCLVWSAGAWGGVLVYGACRFAAPPRQRKTQ